VPGGRGNCEAEQVASQFARDVTLIESINRAESPTLRRSRSRYLATPGL
jgi:hypothetical protein